LTAAEYEKVKTTLKPHGWVSSLLQARSSLTLDCKFDCGIRNYAALQKYGVRIYTDSSHGFLESTLAQAIKIVAAAAFPQ
ncbi:MAG: hypothetical protein ACM3SP_02055, partial [Chloroflexota bacterium]